jgi:hypothetical protein
LVKLLFEKFFNLIDTLNKFKYPYLSQIMYEYRSHAWPAHPFSDQRSIQKRVVECRDDVSVTSFQVKSQFNLRAILDQFGSVSRVRDHARVVYAILNC